MTGALADCLGDALGRGGSTVAAPGGELVPAMALLGHAGAVADRLRGSGVGLGEPVLLAIGNRPLDLAALLGLWWSGAVAVPLHETTPEAVRDGLAERTGARFLLDRGELVPLASDPSRRRELPKDAALILFTSGTTGEPKGVVLGHERFRGKLEVLQRLLGVRADDVVLLPLQLTFVYGLWVSLLTLGADARLVLVPRFRAEGIGWELQTGATVLAAVPTMLRALAAAPLPAPDLRMIITGGEQLGPTLGTTVAETWPGADVIDLYGLTETGSCDFCLMPADRPVGNGSIGHPTEGVAFRLAAEPGEAAGELQIRSPFGMLGYLGDPALTAGAFSDGFFRSGDLARSRPDGRVEIVGRLKEIIARGGNKIAPLEIENLFQGHPAVAAALCAGLPDPHRGEAVHVMLVAKPGAVLDPDGLRDWAGERIERYKLPDRIHLADALPLGPTGKADRGALRHLLAGETT